MAGDGIMVVIRGNRWYPQPNIIIIFKQKNIHKA